MSGLPSGTVTFVFTDVEGSTRLLRSLGEGWGGALADYRRLLRETFGAAGGREVDHQGDGMFFVFPRARAAVAAAAEAQRRLEGHDWPEGALVRVRMGLHTGEPAVGEEGYVGLDVVRAARIASAAHGGQVLLSGTTHALAAREPVEGVGTIYLGQHALRDIPGDEPLHQLVVAGLQTRFEPPRTEKGSAAEPVRIAGREIEVSREIGDAVRLLRTSIEQQVADKLRAADTAREPRRVRYDVQGAPTFRAVFAFSAVVVLGILATIAVIVWLLVR